MEPQSRPEGDGSEEGWSEDRFLELARDGGKDQAYVLLLANLGCLRGYLVVRFLPELGGEQGVEETLHETACRTLERIGEYEPQRGPVLFWAWGIGVHLALDRMRSEEARRARERAVAKPECAASQELLDQVHEHIELMDPPLRTILLFDLEHGGLGPAAELAELLNVEVQTVYNLRRQARAMLARLARDSQ